MILYGVFGITCVKKAGAGTAPAIKPRYQGYPLLDRGKVHNQAIYARYEYLTV
jgi:hypothetical protein